MKFLYVSTCLDYFVTESDPGYEVSNDAKYAHEDHPGQIYRKLDQQYYKWLASKVNMALKAYDSGKLAADIWFKLRWAFNPIEELAARFYGERWLFDAMQIDISNYVRPGKQEKKKNYSAESNVNLSNVSHMPNTSPASHHYQSKPCESQLQLAL